MEKVYEIVSDMILPGFVFALLAVIFIVISPLGKIGERVDGAGEDFSNMADTQAVEAVCNRVAPQIERIGKKVWKPGELIMITDLFAAADAEGRKLDFLVTDITDQNGGSALNCYQESGKQAVFQQSGVYTFCLKTMDRERKISTEQFAILVDDRQRRTD